MQNSELGLNATHSDGEPGRGEEHQTTTIVGITIQQPDDTSERVQTSAKSEWIALLPGALQQLLRIPWVYPGAAAGGAAMGASAAAQSPTCGCQ